MKFNLERLFNKKTTCMSKLEERRSRHYGESEYHEILATIHPKCYVEAADPGRGGTITKVIRDKWGVPVAVQVKSGGSEDCISLEEVCFYEPYYPALLAFISEDRFYTILYPYDRKPERTW